MTRKLKLVLGGLAVLVAVSVPSSLMLKQCGQPSQQICASCNSGAGGGSW